MLNSTRNSKEDKMFSASQSLSFLSDGPSPQPLNPIPASAHKELDKQFGILHQTP